MFPLHLLPELVKNLSDECILRACTRPPPPHVLLALPPYSIISIIIQWIPGSAASSDTKLNKFWVTLANFLGYPRLLESPSNIFWLTLESQLLLF